MATMEDVFEGAVGIDLGTTYSYVLPSQLLPLITLQKDALAFGKTIEWKSSPMTVSHSFFFSHINTTYRSCRGKPHDTVLRRLLF